MPHVLVVDDNQVTAETLAELVTFFGYQAEIANGARFALESIVRQQPALVLLDLNMPSLDGLEVCRYIKRDPLARGTQVVFVSTEDDPTIQAAAREAGAADYLIKPVSIDALESIVEQAMG